MIKVRAEANYGFAGTNMTFEEEFGDDVTDEEIEEAMARSCFQCLCVSAPHRNLFRSARVREGTPRRR